jgi:DNA-binding CsgD family transcriptional regulator
MARLRNVQPGTELTAVELRTIKLAATGASHEKIADLFGVSTSAINMRFYRIGLVLDTHTTAHTVVECLRRGWLTLAELDPAVVR